MKLYKFINKESKTPYFEVTIKADENDADYRTETRKYFNLKEFDEKIAPLFYLLHVWDMYGNENRELSDFPYYYDVGIPSSTNDVCHTIVEKKIYFYNEEGKQLEIKIDSVEYDFYYKEDDQFYDYSNIENLKTEEFMDVYKVLYSIYKVSGKNIKRWKSCFQFNLPTEEEWVNIMNHFKEKK